MAFSSSNSDSNEEEHLDLDLALALESAEEDASLSLPAEVAADVASSENGIMVSSGFAIEELSEADRNLLQGIDDYDAAAVQQAIRNGADVNCVNEEVQYGYTHTTPLLRACDSDPHGYDDGYDEIVRILLDAGANARMKDSNGRTSLVAACQWVRLSTVEMVLNHDNGLLEIADNDGGTPLHYAIGFGLTDIVRFLLDRGANVHAIDEEGLTTLMRACNRTWSLEIVRLLLAAGVDVAAVDRRKQTALHRAAGMRQSMELRELILEHNANMFVVDNDGKTPFDFAARVVNDSADFLLQMYGSKVTEDHGTLALHKLLTVAEYSHEEGPAFHPPLLLPIRIRLPLGALKLNHFRTLLHYLDADSIRNRDDSGKLPIHIACQTNAPVEVLSMLGEMDSATLQITDHSGNLPLHECCSGTVDYYSVLCLVEIGGVGTLAARNHQGSLPLHVLVASTNPTLRTVQYLIQSFPAAVTARTTNDGQYPFMIAAGASSSASLSVVLEIVRANPHLIVPNE